MVKIIKQDLMQYNILFKRHNRLVHVYGIVLKFMLAAAAIVF